MEKIAVLIPCYNEAQTIGKVIGDFKAELPDAVIYVYDNNSTDGSYECAAQAGVVVRRECRQGKGNVVRSMLRDIDAECYILVDGDDTYSAGNAHIMAEKILDEGYDMVIGDRLSTTYYKENKRRFHNTGNSLVCGLVRLMFKSNVEDVKDVMSGYRALSYTLAKSYPIIVKGFEIETDITIFALDKNLRVCSVPADYSDRAAGSESKLRTFKDGFRVIKTIFALCKNFRPLLFFGVMAVMLMLAGGLTLLPVLLHYFRTGLVYQYGAMFSSLFIIVIGILSLMCGIILETITTHNRKSYELHFLSIREQYMRKLGK